DKELVGSLLSILDSLFAQESAGWCTPSRDGLPGGVKILRGLERGEGQMQDIDHLTELTKNLWIGKTFCAHAPGAMEPLQSALKYFRSEFEAGVKPVAAQASIIQQA
ncbi:MAG: NADH-ubiquinone oxidoreductase-F iron-sulfur binding region domain-containing protein, partial [Pseudomonadota bacterium]|nr:NADH-ubiquinone oxidoreductase-F iron-sulfur binding region domain-containing protein [Pseudomonadota bacterium]